MSEAVAHLPSGWAYVPIEQLLEPLQDGRTLHHGWSPQCAAEPAEDGQWGVLKTTAVQDGVFLPEHNKRLPAKLKPRTQFEVRPGDILLTCAGPRVRCGVVCLVRATQHRLILSGKMYRFRGRSAIMDGGYLEAFLRAPGAQRLIDKMKTGISDSGLNLTHGRFFTLRVPVAPLAEQRRIVAKIEELFSDLDAGVAALERVKANLKRYRAAVLKAAVEGRLTEEWRKHNPPTETGEQLLKRILAERRAKWEAEQLRKFAEKGKEPGKGWREKYEEAKAPTMDDLHALPSGWAWSSIDCIADVQGGIQKQPKRSPVKNAYPYLRVANVRRDRLLLDDMEKFELFPGELERLRLEANDLLIVEGNGSLTEIGRSAIWGGEIPNCVHQNHIIRVRPICVLTGFLNTYWNSPIGAKRVMEEAASTSGLYTLSVNKVCRLPVPIPSLTEQAAIVAEVDRRLSVADAAEKQVQAALQRAARLRQAILKRAFEGKLVPQDPKDEPVREMWLDRARPGSDGKNPSPGAPVTSSTRRSRARA